VADELRTERWGWQWVRWASWPVTPAVLVVSATVVTIDVATAWWGQPRWALGGVLLSPALPLAFVLIALVGRTRIGLDRSALAAWRECLVGLGLALSVSAFAWAADVGGTARVAGVAVGAASEEIVYRFAAVVLIGALCARTLGRDWRDTARWGTGPIVVALTGAAAVFSVLPGHVEQMTGASSIVPFASLAVLLGYVALRTGSLLPGVAAHILLDLLTLAFLAGELPGTVRAPAAATVLAALAFGVMVAGRRLGLRRRVPELIDLRERSHLARRPAAG
jgi:hypothetical protein